MRRMLLALVILISACASPKAAPVDPGDPEPPVWVSQFAKGFCQMDATVMAKYLSPIALDLPPYLGDLTADELRPLLPPDWPCKSVVRYLGFGQFGDGSMEYYFRFDFGDHTPTYGFIVEHDRIIRVD